MRIFYAVQATGNGHIAKAIELLPFLQQYGVVDVFLSGSNNDLKINLPVKYKSKGLSLFYHKNGGLDYWRMLKELSVADAYKEARQLPVEKYDIVINDFESITALACKIKKIPSVGFGHQASFQSNKVPRPGKKHIAGELILKRFAVATTYVGLHFEQYDDFIFSPIIKKDILNASPIDKGHVTVYLPHYADKVVASQLHKIRDIQFQVFSKQVNQVSRAGNICYIPVDTTAFNNSMINSTGVITGAGFETPAEALFLGKKLLCLPIKGQYEQLCNAEALKNFNVPVINAIDNNFSEIIKQWVNTHTPKKFSVNYLADDIVQHVINKALHLKKSSHYATSF